MAEATYPLAPAGVFWTVQGEGVMLGVPQVFVRLAGCDVNCDGCDTDYSVAERVGAREIARRVCAAAGGARWVWVTGGFPTYHETDPPELLDDLIPLARERGNWLGMGLLPPRGGKWGWVRATLDRIPEGIHVHVWAGGEYCGHPRVGSVDSTNWFRDAFAVKTNRLTDHLTPAECIECIVKRYQRAERKPVATRPPVAASLFEEVI